MGGKGKGTMDEHMREHDSRGGRGMKWESNEKEILVEKATMGLGSNLVVGKFPRIHKDDSS